MPRADTTPCDTGLVITADKLRAHRIPSHKSLASPRGRGKVSREDYSTALNFQAIEQQGAPEQFHRQKAGEEKVDL